MRTKKGDMVRITFDAYLGLPAVISDRVYSVVSLGRCGTIYVTSIVDRQPITVRSWVRCAEMKETTP